MTSQRTTGVVAVVVVLGSLLALGVWGALTRPSTPAAREPGPPALSGEPSGPGPSAGPTSATASTTPTPTTGAGVDWDAVAYPVDCGGVRLLVVRVLDLRVPGRSRPLEVVEVRCDAGAGSPPSAVLGYDPPATPGAAPRLVGQLVRSSDDVLVTSVDVHATTVAVAGTTYSSAAVPRCCPDRTYRATWTWRDAGFEPVRR